MSVDLRRMHWGLSHCHQLQPEVRCVEWLALEAVVSSVLLTGARRGWRLFVPSRSFFDGKQGYVTRGFMFFGP